MAALQVPLLYLLSLPVLVGTGERLVFLIDPPEGVPLVDARYAEHPVLTLLHLVPGLVFFLLGPLQFSAPLRRVAPRLHRLSGRIYAVCAVVSGLAVVAMVFAFPALGGLVTQITTCALVAAMILLIIGAIRAAQVRRFAIHRAAMTWGFAIGLSVSTARILIESAAWLLDVPFEASFVAASALGVAINLGVAYKLTGLGWIIAALPRSRRGADDL